MVPGWSEEAGVPDVVREEGKRRREFYLNSDFTFKQGQFLVLEGLGFLADVRERLFQRRRQETQTRVPGAGPHQQHTYPHDVPRRELRAGFYNIGSIGILLDKSLLWGIVLCIVDHLAASLASGHWILVAHTPSCDN